jgi:hypothetical protein
LEPNQITNVNPATGGVYLKYPLSGRVPYGPPGINAYIASVNPFYFHDIALSDLTIDSTAGGAALSLQSTIRAQVEHVSLTSKAWGPKVELGGSRHVDITDSYWFSSGGEEVDQATDITIANNILVQESGQVQLSFDEGSDGVRYVGNQVSSSDYSAGVNNRGGSPVVALEGTCANDVLIARNRIVQVTAAGAGIVISEPDRCSKTPNPEAWTIRDNAFVQYVFGNAATAIYEAAAVREQYISNNAIYVRAVAGAARGINVSAGVAADNHIVTAFGGFGMVGSSHGN